MTLLLFKKKLIIALTPELLNLIMGQVKLLISFDGVTLGE